MEPSDSLLQIVIGESDMVDFIMNTVAEIADFFINFWVDKVIDKIRKP